MTTTTVLASCAVGNVDCHDDTASIDLLPLLVVVALAVLGIALLGRQRR